MRKLYAILLLLPGGAVEAQRPPAAPPVESVPSAWRTKYDPYRVDDYAALVRIVEGGIPAVLYVGVKDESVGHYESHLAVPAGFRGLSNGVYDCYRGDDGKARMQRREVKPATVVPAAPFTTRGTPAPTAAGRSTLFPAGPATASTFTPARLAVQRGVTNCGPAG